MGGAIFNMAPRDIIKHSVTKLLPALQQS